MLQVVLWWPADDEYEGLSGEPYRWRYSTGKLTDGDGDEIEFRDVD